MPRPLRKLQALALAPTAVALAFAVTAVGCGDDDESGTGSAGTGTTAAKQKVEPKKAQESQEAYQNAFEACKKFGAAALRANFGETLSLSELADVYVSRQTAYFHPYEEAASRGCEVGLSR